MFFFSSAPRGRSRRSRLSPRNFGGLKMNPRRLHRATSVSIDTSRGCFRHGHPDIPVRAGSGQFPAWPGRGAGRPRRHPRSAARPARMLCGGRRSGRAREPLGIDAKAVEGPVPKLPLQQPEVRGHRGRVVAARAEVEMAPEDRLAVAQLEASRGCSPVPPRSTARSQAAVKEVGVPEQGVEGQERAERMAGDRAPLRAQGKRRASSGQSVPSE